MRILLVGAGGVGDAFAKIAARRSFFDALIVTDYNLERAERTVAAVQERFGTERRLIADQVNASRADSISDAVRKHRATHVLNAVDPRFVMPIFTGAYQAGADYLDMAMSLSKPHPQRPYELPGVKLGDEQFALDEQWRSAGRLALVGIGVEPGLSNVFARYAADHLFDHIEELGTRDGSNLAVDGYDFAPSFSIWTTIEECLNPPVIFERDRGWYTTEPFSEPEIFDFPGGIGPVECVNVEHEEVLMMPRWLEADRVTFKYGLGREFIDVLQTLHKLGLDRTDPVSVKGSSVAGGQGSAGTNGNVLVSPRDVVAACLPDPATLGDRDARRHLRRTLRPRHRQGRAAPRGLPLPCGRQRGLDARLPGPVRRLADRRQPGRRLGAAGLRHLVRRRGGRTRDFRRRPVPGAAEGSGSRRLWQSLDAPGAHEPADNDLIRRHDDRYEAVARQLHRRGVRRARRGRLFRHHRPVDRRGVCHGAAVRAGGH